MPAKIGPDKTVHSAIIAIQRNCMRSPFSMHRPGETSSSPRNSRTNGADVTLGTPN